MQDVCGPIRIRWDNYNYIARYGELVSWAPCLNPTFIATGAINSAPIVTLSPGITCRGVAMPLLQRCMLECELHHEVA